MTQSAHQLRRIFDLLTSLPIAPQDAITSTELLAVPSIAEMYCEDRDRKSSMRMLQRDLDALKVNWPKAIEVVRVKGMVRQARYRRRNQFFSDFMTGEMSLGLVLAQDFLSQTLPDRWYEQLSPLFELAETKLEKDSAMSNWSQRVKVLPEGLISVWDGDNEDAIQTVLKALATGEVCEVIYRRESDNKERTHRILPQGLIVRGGKRLLMATNLKHGYFNTFALHRIRDATLDELDVLDVEDDTSLDELIEAVEYEAAERGEGSVQIRLLCDASLRDHFEQTNLRYGSILTECFACEQTKKNLFVATFDQIVSASLEQWVWQNSANIRVIEPQSLKQRIQDRMLQTQVFHTLAIEQLYVFKHLNAQLEAQNEGEDDYDAL